MPCAKWKTASYKFYALDINNQSVDINKIIPITFDEIVKEITTNYNSRYVNKFLTNDTYTNKAMLNIFLLKGFGFVGNFASYYNLHWLNDSLTKGYIEWPGKHRVW